MQMLGKIEARGDSNFTVDDFDSMLYLVAVVKVGLQPAYLPTRVDR